jgi:hypothetical protein
LADALGTGCSRNADPVVTFFPAAALFACVPLSKDEVSFTPVDPSRVHCLENIVSCDCIIFCLLSCPDFG